MGFPSAEAGSVVLVSFSLMVQHTACLTAQRLAGQRPVPREAGPGQYTGGLDRADRCTEPGARAGHSPDRPHLARRLSTVQGKSPLSFASRVRRSTFLSRQVGIAYRNKTPGKPRPILDDTPVTASADHELPGT
jgi:hypothetical protein